MSDLPFIPDEHVAERVLAHREFVYNVIMVGQKTPTPRQVIEVVRRHSDAVTEALRAYIQGKKLPDYKPLPTKDSGVLDAAKLLSWPD